MTFVRIRDPELAAMIGLTAGDELEFDRRDATVAKDLTVWLH